MDSRFLRGRQDIRMIWMRDAVMVKNTGTAKARRQRERSLGIKNGDEMIREDANDKQEKVHVPQLSNRLFPGAVRYEVLRGISQPKPMVSPKTSSIVVIPANILRMPFSRSVRMPARIAASLISPVALRFRIRSRNSSLSVISS